MSLKRTTIIVVVCAAVAAWFSAAMTPGFRPQVVVPAPPPIDASGEKLAAEIARLHDRLRPDTPPRTRIRNPFAFRLPAPAPTRAPAAAGNTASSPAAPPPVPLVLSGMAENAGPDGPVRTAVISGDGEVFLLKEGESLTLRGTTFRLTKISETTVELLDLSDGTTRMLALK